MKNFPHLIVVMLILSGCRGHFADSKGGGKKTADSKAQEASTRPSEESEGLPGYDLVCAFITEATVQAPQATLGCRFVDKASYETVDLDSFASSWKWEFTKPEGAVMEVSLAEQPKGSEWQVIYTFTGSDGGALQQAALKTQVMAFLTVAADGSQVAIGDTVDAIPPPSKIGSGTETSPN